MIRILVGAFLTLFWIGTCQGMYSNKSNGRSPVSPTKELNVVLPATQKKYNRAEYILY